jgi:tRNA-dihydrouridine synthase 1
MTEKDIEKKEKKEKKDKKEKKKLKKKKKLEDNGNTNDNDVDAAPPSQKKRKYNDEVTVNRGTGIGTITVTKKQHNKSDAKKHKFNFPIKYILAPMVGASELPFRLLCRKYGAQASYTPMMNSHSFATDEQYRKDEFQTIAEDRPLVCHFSSNDPNDFTNAAKLVEDKCDAIDLNLGCPQRTAYLGHFGSYLLEPKDRKLICSIIRKASNEVSIPIFVKIRLLNTIEETIELCTQLKDAGASLIAIHARYRASFERKGAGARDGPAMLDQVLKVRQALGDDDFPLIANGNVVTYDDVMDNLNTTRAHGIMSAEGILDNPALYIPQYGDIDKDGDKEIEIPILTPLPNAYSSNATGVGGTNGAGGSGADFKKKRKLTKKLREIEKLEAKQETLSNEEKCKVALKESIQKEILEIENMQEGKNDDAGETKKESIVPEPKESSPKYEKIPLRKLYETSNDRLTLATEYLTLARRYPTKLRTIVFHTRRMLKHLLSKYQLMEECINSKSINDVQKVITKMRKYERDPSSFHFDKEKSRRDKEALDRKRREEGKRKAYEARMLRKAKREKRDDLEYYLRQGAKVPTVNEVKELRKLSKDEQMARWKAGDHSQHCLAFHLDEGGCKRDRACAFLHADALGENSFLEMDEVAG